MLKETQHNVGYSWQESRLGAATNGISGGLEGDRVQGNNGVGGFMGGRNPPRL